MPVLIERGVSALSPAAAGVQLDRERCGCLGLHDRRKVPVHGLRARRP
jgi:hypothetical protein